MVDFESKYYQLRDAVDEVIALLEKNSRAQTELEMLREARFRPEYPYADPYDPENRPAPRIYRL